MAVTNVNSPIIGIGIDQGIASLGFAVVESLNEQIKVLNFGTFKTKSKDSLPKRIQQIYEMINKLTHEYNGNIIACEKLFFSPKQINGNKKRNKSASIMYTNMATGIIFLVSEQVNIPLKDFVPGTVKKYLTGNGKAEKQAVEEAVLKYLALDQKIKTEHESDAIAIAITAVRYYEKLQANPNMG